MDFLEIYWTDVYKTGHKPMLPTGSTLMYSNNTEVANIVTHQQWRDCSIWTTNAS
jgi:hypothetical protein